MQKPIALLSSSRHIALLLTLALSVGQLHAQSDIFTETTFDPSQFSATQTTRYNKIVNSAEYSEIKYVQIANLANAQLNGRMKVNLSSSSCGEVTFKAVNVEYVDTSDYSWYGEIEPIDTTTPCMEGNLLLMSKNGETFGTMRIGSNHYNIEDLTGGIQAIGKVYFDTMAPLTCGGTDFSSEGGSVQPREFNCDIRVLIMYTTSADQQLGNVQTLAQQCIAITNQAFQNSAVYAESARLILAGVEEFSPYSEAGRSFTTVHNNFRSNPTVLARRAATGADLVVLLVNRNIMDHDEVAGLATGVGAGNPNVAFAVVKALNANDGYVFSHEVGHLIGAHHQPCNATPVNADGCVPVTAMGFNRAHSWVKTYFGGLLQINRNSIMQSQVLPSVVKHYSNPNVKYLGIPTGIANERDNARIIRNNGCIIANYRQEFQEDLSATIIGNNISCENTQEFFSASVSGPPSPIGSYTFNWQVSYDGGITFGNTISTGVDATITMPAAGSLVVIRLTVSVAGQSVIVFHTIQVLSSIDGAACTRSQQSDEKLETQSSMDKNDLFISPNPSGGIFNLNIFASGKSATCVLEAFDNKGMKVKSVFEGQINNKETQITFDGSDLPAGVYWLRLRTPSDIVTRKFTVIK